MTAEERKKLRAHYHALKGQARILDEVKTVYLDESSFRMLQAALTRLNADFPGLVPVLDERAVVVGFRDERESRFVVRAIRAHLASVLGTLEVEVDDSTSEPVIEVREFNFVVNPDIRKIIERDYQEIQRAFVSRCWKSVIILSGGAIEAILADLLLVQSSTATAAQGAPKNHDITRWDLADLINVAVELQLVGAGIEKLSHSVREYRNLVHPGNEVRNRLDLAPEEAKIALEVLHMLHRELSP